MEKIGIIDIGSNSVRLVVATIIENKAFKIIDELKESVRLAEGMEKTGELNNLKIKNAIQTLKMFKQLCEAQKIKKIIVIATAAVRNAANKDVFISRVKKELGLDIRVLTGEEEAYYAYWGTVNSMNIEEGLIMDLGGGSTELVWFKNRKILKSVSLPFGSITLTRLFNLQEKNPKEADLRNYLIRIYREIPWLAQIKNIPLVGTGGTFRNIGKIDREQKKYPLSITHNYHLESKDIQNIYTLIKNTPLNDRKKIKGLSKDRGDIISGAISAIKILIEVTGLNKILISGNGIREGLIYDYLFGKNPVDNVLDFSINNAIYNFNLDINHSTHIYKLVNSLYEQFKPFLQLKIQPAKILKTAAMLHDSGINIRYYGHHEHSFYMILNAGIYGLTHKELLLSALLASYHRKKKPKKKREYRGVINKEEMKDIEKLGILLSIAESFDRSMNGVIKEIKCDVLKDKIIIKTISRDNSELEIKDAMKVAQDFKKVFKRKLEIIY